MLGEIYYSPETAHTNFLGRDALFYDGEDYYTYASPHEYAHLTGLQGYTGGLGFLKKLGSWTKRTVKKAGSKIKQATNYVGSKVKKVGKSVAKGAKNVWNITKPYLPAIAAGVTALVPGIGPVGAAAIMAGSSLLSTGGDVKKAAIAAAGGAASSSALAKSNPVWSNVAKTVSRTGSLTKGATTGLTQSGLLKQGSVASNIVNSVSQGSNIRQAVTGEAKKLIPKGARFGGSYSPGPPKITRTGGAKKWIPRKFTIPSSPITSNQPTHVQTVQPQPVQPTKVAYTGSSNTVSNTTNTSNTTKEGSNKTLIMALGTAVLIGGAVMMSK